MAPLSFVDGDSGFSDYELQGSIMLFEAILNDLDVVRSYFLRLAVEVGFFHKPCLSVLQSNSLISPNLLRYSRIAVCRLPSSRLQAGPCGY